MTVDRARAYIDLDGRLPFDTLRDHRDSDLKLWCVYVHLDQDGYALYIGSTSDLKKREANHRYRSNWWPQVTEIRTIGRWTKEIALGVEAGLIHRFQPPYNGHFTGRWESALADRAEQRRDITYYPRMQIAAPEAWDRIAPLARQLERCTCGGDHNWPQGDGAGADDA